MSGQDPQELLDRIGRARVSRRGFLAASGLGATSAFLAACAGGTNPSTAPSSAPVASPSPAASGGAGAAASPQASYATEGSLFMYNWSDYVAPDNVDEFKKRYNISEFTYDTYASNEELLTKLQGGATGQYDVGAPTAEFVPALVDGGYIQKLDWSRLPNAAYIDPQFQKFFKDGSGLEKYNDYHLPKDWGTTGIALRRKDVQDDVSTWKKFFEVAPKYSGKIVIVDSPGDVFTAPLKALGYSLNSTDKTQLEEVRKILMDFAPHVLALNSDTYQDLLRTEEAVLGLTWTGGIDDLRKDAATKDTEYIIPKDGTLVWLDTWVIFANPPHPEAAYAFLNFIQEPPIQAKETEVNAYATANLEAMKLISQDMLSDPTVFVPEDVLKSGLLEGAVDVSADPLRQEIWEQFKSSIGR